MKLVRTFCGFRKFDSFYVGCYRSKNIKGYHKNNGACIGYMELGINKRFYI